jgi:hypothetical protein
MSNLLKLMNAANKGDRYGTYKGYPYYTKSTGATIIYDKINQRLAIWESHSFEDAFKTLPRR